MAHDHAFRGWSQSSPSLGPQPEIAPAENASGPLTYQVYTPQDLARPISLSRGEISVPKGTSLGLKICMLLLGVCVVFGTAAAIIAVSSDDAPAPKPATRAASTASAAPVETAPPVVPVSTVVTPPPMASTAPAEPPPAASAPSSTSTTKKPRSGAAPSALKGVTPPPNPYAGHGHN